MNAKILSRARPQLSGSLPSDELPGEEYVQPAAAEIYNVDSSEDGIEFGRIRCASSRDIRLANTLCLESDPPRSLLRSRHPSTEESLAQLEAKLKRVSVKGDLRSAYFFFGVQSDPFYPFEGKFDASRKFLRLFERYVPGMLIIQTRSPLIVIAPDLLKKLGKRVAVTIALETPLESAARRYTPNLPAISERLRAAAALRTFGIEVTIQVAPLLPYGDLKRDAQSFADLLCRYPDYILIDPINDGSCAARKKINESPLCRMLRDDGRDAYLQAESARYLNKAVSARCPSKLAVPVRSHMQERQIKIF